MKTQLLFLSFIFFISTSSVNYYSMQPSYELVVKDTSGGPRSPQILVVKEYSSLKEFYSKVNQTRRPGLALPKVDFDKEFILILCLGTMQTTGHDISITKLNVSKDELTIFVSEEHPKDLEKMPKVLNEPFSIYKVKGNYTNIQFKKTIID
ncbi:hypothetical protein [Ascidiimonas sp. W6]|uniref:hypothetical protein n=1 Tax=Ascidiimonas meishanensis TaxID=3128903 RepID=UPI0030EF9C7C